MRNFDVELAKKGWPVVMRDETSARIICYDKRDPRPIVALYMMCDAEIVSEHYKNGRYEPCLESDFDLFLTDTWEGHDENGNPIGIVDYFERIGEPKPDLSLKDERPESLVKFGSILDKMYSTYEAKNHDYGDSFGRSIQSYGPIAGLTRIGDKFHRLESLIVNGDRMVNDEKIGDTLLDMANYCVMLKMEIEK